MDDELKDIDIDELFKDDTNEDFEELTDNENEEPEEPKDMTKAVSERINTVRRKTENATEERIAKELGFDSYEELRKANETKMFRDAGLDEEEVGELVDKLVEQRLSNDPRFKKLAKIEEDEKSEFVRAQLKEINGIAGTNFTSVEQLPKDTLNMWEKIGNLSQAYMATEGANLLNRNRAIKSNGSLNHLASTSGGANATKRRPLTDEEKEIYRLVNPDITEEELSKKFTDIE